jgi:hypothetical protein
MQTASHLIAKRTRSKQMLHSRLTAMSSACQIAGSRSQMGAAHQLAPTTIGTMLHMADARWSLPDSWLSQLALSQPLQHDALHPVYGHELHFKLAKGNQHG